MKKNLSKNSYSFLVEVMHDLHSKGIVTESQQNEYLADYSTKKAFSFIRMISIFGSALVGLGFLLLVASNWYRFLPGFKISIIIAAFLVFLFCGILTEKKSQILSKSLIYISCFVYLAGVLLINDIFKISIEGHTMALLVSIGLVPLAIAFKDQFIAAAALVCAAVLSINLLDFGVKYSFIYYVYPLALAFGAFFYTRKSLLSRILEMLSYALMILASGIVLKYLEVDNLFIMLFVLVLSGYMYYSSRNIDKYLPASVAIIISVFAISFKDIWDLLDEVHPEVYSTGFSIAAALAFLFLIRLGRYLGVAGLSVLILRYYFDTLYDEMPRSLFFIVGGLLLVGIAFFMDRMRRERIGDKSETKNNPA